MAKGIWYGLTALAGEALWGLTGGWGDLRSSLELRGMHPGNLEMLGQQATSQAVMMRDLFAGPVFPDAAGLPSPIDFNLAQAGGKELVALTAVVATGVIVRMAGK